jgi:hypothetical protein
MAINAAQTGWVAANGLRDVCAAEYETDDAFAP